MWGNSYPYDVQRPRTCNQPILYENQVGNKMRQVLHALKLPFPRWIPMDEDIANVWSICFNCEVLCKQFSVSFCLFYKKGFTDFLKNIKHVYNEFQKAKHSFWSHSFVVCKPFQEMSGFFLTKSYAVVLYTFWKCHSCLKDRPSYLFL